MPTPQLIQLGISTIDELAALATLFGFQVRNELPKEPVPHWEGNRLVTPSGEIVYQDKEPLEPMPPTQFDYSLGMPTGKRNARPKL